MYGFLATKSILSDNHSRVSQSSPGQQDAHVHSKQREQWGVEGEGGQRCVRGRPILRMGKHHVGLWLKRELGKGQHVVPCGGVWAPARTLVTGVREHWNILGSGFELHGELWVGNRLVGKD